MAGLCLLFIRKPASAPDVIRRCEADAGQRVQLDPRSRQPQQRCKRAPGQHAPPHRERHQRGAGHVPAAAGSAPLTAAALPVRVHPRECVPSLGALGLTCCCELCTHGSDSIDRVNHAGAVSTLTYRTQAYDSCPRLYRTKARAPLRLRFSARSRTRALRGSVHPGAGLTSRSTSRDWSGLGSRTSTQGSGGLFWAANPNPEADDRALLEALVESPVPSDASLRRPVTLAAVTGAAPALRGSSRRASATRSAQPSSRRLSRGSSSTQAAPPAQVCCVICAGLFRVRTSV